MSIVPYGERMPVRSERKLAKLEEATQLAEARVRAVARVEATKVESIGYVADAGLITVTNFSVVQAECAKVAPDAALRLAAIGDAATVSVQSVILQFGRKL